MNILKRNYEDFGNMQLILNGEELQEYKGLKFSHDAQSIEKILIENNIDFVFKCEMCEIADKTVKNMGWILCPKCNSELSESMSEADSTRNPDDESMGWNYA